MIQLSLPEALFFAAVSFLLAIAAFTYILKTMEELRTLMGTQATTLQQVQTDLQTLTKATQDLGTAVASGVSAIQAESQQIATLQQTIQQLKSAGGASPDDLAAIDAQLATSLGNISTATKALTDAVTALNPPAAQ